MLKSLMAASFALIFTDAWSAQPPPAAQVANVQRVDEAFERRISARAEKLLHPLKLTNADVSEKALQAVTTFYRDLNAYHAEREQKLAQLAGSDCPQVHRLEFESDKQIQAVHGKLIGTLSRVLTEDQVVAVKDGMTFNMVPLSKESYQRMFPNLNARQAEQLHAWLIEARERAIVAGSAEAKLDVFRVNKMRMHAYLAAQGFDVDAAMQKEELRKAEEKKSAR